MTRPTALLTALFAFLLIVSRVPLMPGQLFSEDEINFAYAIGELDTRIGQPQPPGYPVFVLETRILDALRFKRPESNLHALAYLASAASLVLIVLLGNRMFGRHVGWWAAALLIFYPTFWFGALTSAVRVHLAVVSLGVAWTCWRLIEGGGRHWLYASTLALGIGSGIRPELGPLLLPLWLWCVWRGERTSGAPRSDSTWPHRFYAGALLSACVVTWTSWVALSSGGYATYFTNMRGYLNDQVDLAPTVVSGATVAAIRILVWAFPILPALILPAILAGTGAFTRRQAAFLLLWIAPLIAFAAWVHLADPGHALAMVPIVCLAGGALIARAIERWGSNDRRETIAILVLAAALAMAMLSAHAWQLALLIGSGILAALLIPKAAPAPRPWYLGLVLLAPALCWNAAVFLQPAWRAPEGPPLWTEINKQTAGVNLNIVNTVVGIDHRSIVRAREWIAQRPDDTIVVWLDSATHWRKAAYYLPTTPIYVVTPATPFPGSPLILEIARQGRTTIENPGTQPLTIRATPGSRVVWMINPNTPLMIQLYDPATDNCIGEGVCRMDLDEGHGRQSFGGFTIEW